MGVGNVVLRLWWLFFVVFAIICFAGNIVSLSGKDMVIERSLKMITNDYSDPSASKCHDPSNKAANCGSGKKNPP